MQTKTVCVLGAGSVEYAPHAIVTLASLASEFLLDIRLFDSNEERLDLLDRLGRVCLDMTKLGHSIRSSSDPAEMLEDATAVIIAVSEDCARRIAAPGVDVEGADPDETPETELPVLEFGMGDPNRPTPVEKLSHHTRLILQRPNMEISRLQAMETSREVLLPLVADDARVLNLVEGFSFKSGEERIENWPERMSPEQVEVMPHQILRWIQGDPVFGRFIEENRRSPFAAWLNQL